MDMLSRPIKISSNSGFFLAKSSRAGNLGLPHPWCAGLEVADAQAPLHDRSGDVVTL
jgi:hypothetical protein